VVSGQRAKSGRPSPVARLCAAAEGWIPTRWVERGFALDAPLRRRRRRIVTPRAPGDYSTQHAPDRSALELDAGRGTPRANVPPVRRRR
jgi:hypothetical protein